MFDLLLTQSGGFLSGIFGSYTGIATTVLYVIAFLAVMYFLMIRPSQKEQKRLSAMKESMEDDTVVVEFGSNKNCRIPMKKEAIASIEKKNNE